MKFRIVLLLNICFAAGCGDVSIDQHSAPVDVKVTVTRAGKPVDKVNFNFQPTGAGLPAVVPIVNGTFQSPVTPGKYTWYLSAGASAKDFQAIPAGFQQGSMDRQFEVAADTTSLDLKVE